MDYALSYVVSSCFPIVLYLLLDSNEQQLQQNSWILIGVAMIGGTLLAFGNLAMQWSVVVFGAPLTTVLAIQASLTVVLGTSLNYLLQPSMTARPSLLFCGIVSFLLAIGLATCAQTSYKNQHKYTVEPYKTIQGGGLIALPTMETTSTNGKPLPHYGNVETKTSTLDDDDDDDEKKNDGTNATSTLHVDRADSFYGDTRHSTNNTRMGLCIAFTGGLFFGFFSPAFNVAVNDPWTFSATGLSVAMANIWFSIAFCLASILGNVHLMTNYSSQSTLIPHSTVTAYLTQSCWSDRRTALLGGCLCALGNLLQFQGGKLAGFATADLVQAFPLVATVWDVAVFGEFRRATRNVVGILVSMYLAYLAGIALLACSIDY